MASYPPFSALLYDSGSGTSETAFLLSIWLPAKPGHRRQEAEGRRQNKRQEGLALSSSTSCSCEGHHGNAFPSRQRQFISPTCRTRLICPPQKAAPACSCSFRGPSSVVRGPAMTIPPELLGYQHQPFSFNNLNLPFVPPALQVVASLCNSFIYVLPFRPPVTLQPIPQMKFTLLK